MSGIHEATCPIPLEKLGFLLRCAQPLALETIDGLPSRVRAELAAFCARRAHMRDLAMLVASRCDRISLERLAGAAAGAMLFTQSREGQPPAPGAVNRKPVISLARRAG